MKKTTAVKTASTATAVTLATPVQGTFSGHYNNTLNAVINTNAGQSDLDWMVRNKLNPTGWDYNTFYNNSSLLANKNFPQFVLNAYNSKIKVGIPFSADSEVNAAIAYNKAQTDSRKKISHIVSEIEDYGAGNATPAQFKSLMENNYIKCKGAGIRFGCYNGWTKQWDMVVANTDFILLHCYIPSANMSSAKAIYDYVSGRLALIAAAGKAQGKIVHVSIIYSSEPAFGAAYFKTNDWATPHNLFTAYYATKASATMKQWLIIDGAYEFVTKYGKIAKP